jgi:hypothetical protein
MHCYKAGTVEKSKKLTLKNFTLCVSMLSQLVLDTIVSCPNPLFISMLMKDVVTWSSSVDVTDLQLPRCADDSFNHLLTYIESRLGVKFVSHTLSYITVSDGGLSEVGN